MATYVLFGNYSTEALRSISTKRTDEAAALLRKHGGELKAGYALLGDTDLLLVVDLADNERAMKVSAELNKLLGISFRTAPALTISEFDRVMTK
jgi:uncharacterized protein with GYD domain